MRVSLATPPKTVGPTRARPLNSFKAPLVGRERGGSDDHSTLARASLVLGTTASGVMTGHPPATPERQRAKSEADHNIGWTSIPAMPCPGTGRNYAVAAYQNIGDRKTQEDRYTLVPRLDPGLDVVNSFFGVFDGTVGDFASHTVKDLVVPKLLESPNWKAFRQNFPLQPPEEERLLYEAFHDMYRSADTALLAQCARHTQHYATCTSVTVLIIGDLLVVGHLGDSRVILVKEEEPGVFVGEQLTIDHKPDLELERQRIEQCGGMVERLQNHGNKPFIRGGDFMMRKALGEQPMQLQYSRAFGAKDLKIFGLSCVPDVKIIRMGSSTYKNVRFLVLASDGLWDVISTAEAARKLQEAQVKREHPAETLVQAALHQQARLGGRADNITAVTVQFDQ